MKAIAAFLIPLALQSYEETTAKLVEDLAAAANGPAKVAVGDEYTKLLKKFPKKRQELLDAASDAYAKSWPDLDPIWKMKLRERLTKLYAPTVPGKPGALPAGWGGSLAPGTKVELRADRVHTGQLAVFAAPGKTGLGSFLRSPEIQIPKGREIEFSAWGLSDDELQGMTVVLHLYDAKGMLLGSVPLGFQAVPVFVRASARTEIPEGTTKALIDCVSSVTKGPLLIDDLSIKVDGKEQLKGGGFER